VSCILWESSQARFRLRSVEWGWEVPLFFFEVSTKLFFKTLHDIHDIGWPRSTAFVGGDLLAAGLHLFSMSSMSASRYLS
jgi:hypothetical protein